MAENAADDATVGVTGAASDADGSTNTITYTMTISTSACAGWFDIGSSSGVVAVDGTNELNYETATSCAIVINAESADGSDTDSSSITISITDHDEFDVGAPSDANSATNTVEENAASSTTVGVTATASDADGSTNTITYSITAQSCAGVFTVGSSSGVVTVDSNTCLLYTSDAADE